MPEESQSLACIRKGLSVGTWKRQLPPTLRMNVGGGAVQPKGGHNWVVRKAFDFLRKNCPELIPEGLEETYVHYGLAFADSPWLGRPETFDSENPSGKRVEAIREDLWGQELGSPGGLWGKAAVAYGKREDKNYPNLCLFTEWLFEALNIDLLDRRYAADNVSHYANDDKLSVDGTWGSYSVLAEGPEGQGTWAVKGSRYASILYDLACRFWPGSPVQPRLDVLPYVPKVGRICCTAGFADYHVNVPGTYLGGNPFIMTSDGQPTWPIWVPGEYSPDKLCEVQAEQSKRTSAIYLGWAVHILQDYTVIPSHARSTTGQHHQFLENVLDHWILDEDKFKDLPIHKRSDTDPDCKYVYSDKPVYWPDWWRMLTTSRHSRGSLGENFFRETIGISKSFVVDLTFSDGHPHPSTVLNAWELTAQRRREEQLTRKRLAAFEYLLDMAIKRTAFLIVYLNHYQGSLVVSPWLSILLLGE